MYRMIVSFGIFVPSILLAGLLWPRKTPQKHYDSPLLHIRPPVVPINDCTPCVEIETIPDTQTIVDRPCFICMWDTTSCDYPRIRLLTLIDQYHTTMSTSELANMIHEYYRRVIHQQGESMPEYSEIVSHLNDHRVDEANKLVVQSFRDCKSILDLSKDMIIRPDGSVDRAILDVYSHTRDRLVALYKSHTK